MESKSKFSEKMAQHATLPFFPAAFPDEAIISQVSRYHVLRGYQTMHVTYSELFQSAPFNLTYWVPPHLDKLANKLPGSPQEHHAAFIKEGTLLPLFQTFGKVVHVGKEFISLPGDVPRRIVGESGTTHLCLSCVVEDTNHFGTPYIHRAHQIPGVTACWKHGTKTIERCPTCRCPLERPKSLIVSPWKACACGRNLEDQLDVQEQATQLEVDFARFAKGLLDAAVAVAPAHLVDVYKRRILQLGFRRGNNRIDRAGLAAAITEHYDKEQLGKMDFAYRKGRLGGWLNILNANSVVEVPLGRHLLIAHFLFREHGLFLNMVRLDGKREPARSRPLKVPPNFAEQPVPCAQKSDLLVSEQVDKLTIFATQYQYGLEELWVHSYGAMKQLVKLDPDASKAILKRLSDKPSIKIQSSIVRERVISYDRQFDQDWAEAIEVAAEKLYACSDKPVKVTMNRLLKMAVVKRGWPCMSSFPLTRTTLEKYRESQWHFYARRIIWVLLSCPEKAGRESQLIDMAGLEHHRGTAIIRHFRQINFRQGLPTGAIISSLQKCGISTDWHGPDPDRDFYVTGRNYTRKNRISSPSHSFSAHGGDWAPASQPPW